MNYRECASQVTTKVHYHTATSV